MIERGPSDHLRDPRRYLVTVCPVAWTEESNCLRLAVGERAAIADSHVTRLPGVDPHRATA